MPPLHKLRAQQFQFRLASPGLAFLMWADHIQLNQLIHLLASGTIFMLQGDMKGSGSTKISEPTKALLLLPLWAVHHYHPLDKIASKIVLIYE